MLLRKPQIQGVCVQIITQSPKKPNSGLRKIAKIQVYGKKIIKAYIPGEGFALNEYDTVLVRNGKTQDLPGVKYKLVRGARDVVGVKGRKTSRSKYGVKKKC